MMPPSDAHEPALRRKRYKQGLTLQYCLALTLVGALALLGHAVSHHILITIDRVASVTAICGSQRLLTQRVLAQCLLLAAADDAEARQDIRIQLSRVATQLAENHKQLLEDRANPDSFVARSPELAAIYFKPPFELDKRMRFFVQSIRRYLEVGAPRPSLSDPDFLNVLAFGEREVLRDLNAVVQTYQRLAYSRLTNLRHLEAGTIVALLLVLVGVGVFLFRPMVRRICEDRIRLEEANMALERLAVTDQLTGAFNRLRLAEVMDQEMQRSRRYAYPLSVVMFDIDHFKRVNDTWGHGAGDDLLRELARLVMTNIRSTDALFRYGGEEFLVTLPHGEILRAAGVAEKLRALVAGHMFPHDLRITISLGVATLLPDDTEQSLMNRVDAAMYRAKTGGRNQVALADDLDDASGCAGPVPA